MSSIGSHRFLSHLAVEANVAAATQNQLPVVLSEGEVKRLLAQMEGEPYLMAALSYGVGLRVSKCMRLRVKDVDLERGAVMVRSGKRGRGRQSVLPEGLTDELVRHLEGVCRIYEQDRTDGLAGEHLPKALERKYRNAGTEWRWFWVFPSEQLSVDPRSKIVCRHHKSPVTLHRRVRDAARAAEIPKHVTVHTLRHKLRHPSRGKGV